MGVGGGQDAKAQGTRGRKTRKAGHNGGAEGGRRGKGKKKKKKKPNNNHKQGNPSPEGAEQTKSEGEAHQNAPGRPARPTRPSRARTRTAARQPAKRAGSRGWESARPRTPHTQARGAPPGTLMPPPQRAKPARKSARCGVGDRSPRPHPPRTYSQWVVGPGSPPRGRAVGGGRAPDPGRPTPRQEAPPPGRPRAAPTARKASSKERALWGWWRVPTPAPPRTQSQWVAGPGSPPRGRAVGGGRAPNPERPTPRAEAPPRAPSCHPHSAQSQLARARAVGLVTGPHARIPPHPQPVGSGPRQPAQRAGSLESARPRTPHTEAGGVPPRAPSCRPHSAQSQLEKARAVGLVTGPHARTPPYLQPVGSGPQQPAQRAGSRGWESDRPRTPHAQAGGAPPGAPMPPPQRAKPARKSAPCRLVTGPHARTPPHPQPVGSGPRQPAQRAGSRGWESA